MRLTIKYDHHHYLNHHYGRHPVMSLPAPPGLELCYGAFQGFHHLHVPEPGDAPIAHGPATKRAVESVGTMQGRVD